MSLREVKAQLQKVQTQLQEKWQWADQVESSWAADTKPAQLAQQVKGNVTQMMLLLIPVQASISINFMQREQARWFAVTGKGAQQ